MSEKNVSNPDKLPTDTLWSRLVEGRLVSGDFFTRYWVQIFVIVAMLLVYITNRYSCQRSMEQIRTLNNRLEVVQSESYRVRGNYMSRIRESAMREMLDSLGLRELAIQNQPPFHVTEN